MDTLLSLIAQNPFVYAVGGVSSVLFYLLLTGKAKSSPVDPGCGTGGCWDIRCRTEVQVLGGAAGFTFGVHYWLIEAFVAPPFLRPIVFTYAVIHTVGSTINTVHFIMQTGRGQGTLPLAAHWDCGYTTAISPLWIFFFARRLSIVALPIRMARECLTVIDFAFSLPAVVFLLPLLVWRKVVPKIRPVDVTISVNAP